MRQIKIYLAGPEVFEKNPTQVGEGLKKICEKHGFIGLFPMDAQVNLDGKTNLQKALAIYHADVSLIHECDALVANMAPFRGPSMDVGTAFEIGYAAALGKPVFGYSNDTASYHEKVAQLSNRPCMKAEDGTLWDYQGRQIETFGLIDNLMMVGAVTGYAAISRTFEESLLEVKRYFSWVTHLQQLKKQQAPAPVAPVEQAPEGEPK